MVSLKTVGGFLAVAALSLGLAACGGDDDSKVSGSKKMTDLTAAEKQQLCDEGKDQAASHEDAFNKFSCYIAQAFSQTCSDSAAQACITAAENAPTETEECHVDVTAACTATVGEIRACQEASVAAIETATDGLTCANFSTKFAGLQNMPAACATAQQKCPELFEDDDGEDSNP
jgi:hypothetical protein